MLNALKQRAVALLWCGQALSAIGDEIYRVALIWLAVNLIGPDAGYIPAAQCAAFLLFALFAGSWADQWDHFKTMIRVDLLRAFIVLIPVALFHFIPTSLPVLGLVAFSIAGLGAFFDPALMATVPRFAQSTEDIKATTGLMATTFRLARAIGPTIVGLLSMTIPMIHFFTLDSVSFLLSAASIVLLSREPMIQRKSFAPHAHPSFKESLLSGIRVIRSSPIITRLLWIKSIGGGLWYLVYGLGTALFVQKLAPGDGRAFGLVVGSYGIGNFAGALLIGNMKRKNSVFILFLGYLWLGIGFVAMGRSPDLYWLMLASAWSGFGGPMNDLPFVDMIQTRYPIHEIPKIFRLRMAGEIGACLVFMSFAPIIFRMIPVQSVIWITGLVYLLFSIYGFVCLTQAVDE